MDLVLIKKVIAHFCYPAGVITLAGILALLLFLTKKPKRACFFTALALSTFLASSNPLIARSLVKNLEQRYPQSTIATTPAADAIIVLGGSLALPIPPREFPQFTFRSNRFWLAGKLYLAGKAPLIILSGGNVFPISDIRPEAEYIRNYLLEMGVPDNAIILDIQSRTTKGNMLETEKILKQKQVESALLVTSALHMPRSMQLFSQLETTIIPISSDVSVTTPNQPLALQLMPSSRAFDLTTQALHEYYGIFAEHLKTLLSR